MKKYIDAAAKQKSCEELKLINLVIGTFIECVCVYMTEIKSSKRN